MKSTLHIISDSDKHFASAIAEYTKRLSKSVTIKTLKPTKYGSRDQIITTETQTLINSLKSNSKTLILSPTGESRSTDDRVKACWGKNTHIVIGGPYGLDYSQFKDTTHVSLGAHTMPHGLAKLIVLEQLYRVQSIGQGKKYHY